jgi:hypothetical protein
MEGGSVRTVKMDMKLATYNDVATQLSLVSLERKRLIDSNDEIDQNGEPDTTYVLTHHGIDWLLSNHEKLELRLPSSTNDMPH